VISVEMHCFVLNVPKIFLLYIRIQKGRQKAREVTESFLRSS
jgi:hypothetical protein